MADETQDQVMFQSPTTGAVQAVPPEHWEEALGKGYKPTTHTVLYSPEGKRGMVANEELPRYTKQGYTTAPKTQFERERPGKGITTEGLGGGAWSAVKGFGKGLLSLVDPTEGLSGAALTAAHLNPRGGTVGERLHEIPAVAMAHEIKSAYQAPETHPLEVPLAGLGALAGVSSESMREHARRGEGGAILGEAAVPALAAVGGEALSMGRPRLARALEERRLTRGPAKVTQALETPAGKGGARAASMEKAVQDTMADLAEIERKEPGKAKGAERFHETAEKVAARREQLWDQGHEPGIARHAEAPINHEAVRAAGAQVLTPEALEAAKPGEAAGAQDFLERMSKERTLRSADDLVREINGDMKGKRAEAYGPLELRVRQSVVQALRGEIDRTLAATGEQGVREVNRRWGALGEIEDRLREQAYNLARQEAKRGSLPEWAHVYAFLHPGGYVPLSIGLGARLAQLLRPSAGSRLASGMRMLSRTGLEAPFEAPTPEGWNRPPAGLLPAPPHILENPLEPATPGRGGVEAQRQVYRDPATGRMQRGYLGEPIPMVLGQTAEGGPIYEPRVEPFQPSTPVEHRRLGSDVGYLGPERRTSLTENLTNTEERGRQLQYWKGVRDDPAATARDKTVANLKIQDLEEHPFVGAGNREGELDVNKLKARNKPTLSREEAERNQELRHDVQKFSRRRGIKGGAPEKPITGKPFTFEGYHGSDTDKIKAGRGGTFIANDKDTASEYGNKQHKVTVSLKKPFVVEGDNIDAAFALAKKGWLDKEIAEDYAEKVGEGQMAVPSDFVDLDGALAEILTDKGYDGIIYNHGETPGEGGGNREVTAFNLKSIKKIRTRGEK